MSDSPDDINALADRLVAAIEAGDVEGVAAIYADDAVIWHNTDQVEQPQGRQSGRCSDGS